MALLDRNNPKRTASVVSETKCSLAVLTFKNFLLICDSYPSFKRNITLLVRKRTLENFEKEKAQKLLDEQKDRSLGALEEHSDEISDSTPSSNSSLSAQSSD